MNFFNRTFLSLLLFSVSLFVDARPSIRDYAAKPSVDMVSISPSGDLVAFLKRDGRKEMVIVYSNSQGKVINGLDASDLTPRDLYFASDDYLIFVASEYRGINANYIGKYEIGVAYGLNVKTGKLNQLLVPGRGIYTGQIWLSRVLGITPDDTALYMPAYVAKKDYNHDPDRSLVKVTLGKKGKPKIIVRGTNHSTDYFLNSKGAVIAQERYDNQKNLHTMLVPDGDVWKGIFTQKTGIKNMNFVGVSSDEKSLVVFNDGSSEGSRAGYFEMSLADGTLSGPFHEKSGAVLDNIILDINRRVVGVSYGGFSPDYHFFDDSVNKRFTEFAQKFPGNSVYFKRGSNNFEHLVVFVTGVGSSGDYYLLSEGKAPHFIASSRPKIKPENVHPIGRADYKAQDGLTIPTLITIPKHKVGDMKNLPAIMLPHGGPASQDRLQFDWWAQAFANAGYLVVQPQFRGSVGFGMDHEEAGYGEWGKKMQTDLSDGIDHLVKKGMVDPERVCIMGGSYGGYAALAGGAFTPNYYKCIISVNGVGDLYKMMHDEKMEHGSDHWVVSYWKRFMTNDEVSRKRLNAVSPARFAENFTAPVLLLHGTRDTIVLPNQSAHMQNRLKKAKKDVRYIKLKKENHWLDSSASRETMLRESIKFVNEVIGKPAN